MHQVAARRHHNKKRAEGFIPNQHGQDNTNNDSGDTPNGANGGTSSSAAASSSVAQSSSAAPSRTVAATTTTTPAAQSTTSSTQQTSSTTTTTSSTPVTTSSSTTVIVQNTVSVNQIPTTASVPITRSVATPTIGTATFSSASASATAAAESSGPQIGPLIGAIGGGLVGVIALAAIAGYFFRRAFRKKDEFDRAEFVRNSVAITDDWTEKPPMGTQNAMALARANNNIDEPSAAPRPPTMIERRGQAPQSYGVGEVMNTGYYGQQDPYYNYGNNPNNGYYGHDQYAAGYDQQYAAGEHPYAAGAAYGYTPPNEYQQSQLTRKPSAPLGTARGQDHVASPAEGDHSTAAQYDSRHQSVTPFQQQQYNDINKVLNGGDTPTTAAPAGGRELSTAYSTLNQPQQPAQGQQQHLAAGAHQPAANNRKSVYDDEEDAYGGI